MNPNRTEKPNSIRDTSLFRSLKPLVELVLAWLMALRHLLERMPGKGRRAKPWHLRIGRKGRPTALNEAEVQRLLQKHRDLKDVEKLAALSRSYRLPESDFFGDPQQIERLIRHLLADNPPWLHIARVLSGSEAGAEAKSTEFLIREQLSTEVQDVTLFVPDESWRDKPLASLTQRPARNMREVWQARLLDQILPPEVLVDRLNRGELMIPVRQGKKQRLDFTPIQRRMEITLRKPVPIPIETESGNGKGGQLVYFLLDSSASMTGKSATLAMAVIAATLRANMGLRDTRYLFRRYAEEVWPRQVELPIQARALEEKDALLDLIFATNFNGSATHVNDALNVAVTDIENLRREERLEASLLLVTDGRAEILESTRLRLVEARVKVHTVMVTPEPNPGLEAISESFTALDINPDQPIEAMPTPLPVAPQPEPRRAYHI